MTKNLIKRKNITSGQGATIGATRIKCQKGQQRLHIHAACGGKSKKYLTTYWKCDEY